MLFFLLLLTLLTHPETRLEALGPLALALVTTLSLRSRDNDGTTVPPIVCARSRRGVVCWRTGDLRSGDGMGLRVVVFRDGMEGRALKT